MAIFRSQRYYRGPPSDHFDGHRFFLPDAPLQAKLASLLKWRLWGRRSVWPRHIPLENVHTPVKRISDALRVTYIGHATVLLQADNLNILTDPQFSQRASPIRWGGPKRVQSPGVSIGHLPPIDAVFVSHNHYDHLDIPSLQKIWKRDQPLIVTPLGNDTIIKRAIKNARVTTLDWKETITFTNGVTLQLLPCQHWSARSPFDRNRALWGTAMIQFSRQSVLYMADSGFNEKLFKSLRSLMASPPDVAILPIGTYDPRWFMSYAHMCPEEAWETFCLLEASYLIPIHYDIFPLADEPYGEAVDRLKAVASKQSNRVIALPCGQHHDFYPKGVH